MPEDKTAKRLGAAGRLANGFGVNHATVAADGAFASAVDAIAKNVGEDAAREIRAVSPSVRLIGMPTE
jgi:hypothetical protein